VPNEFSRTNWRRAADNLALGENEIHVWLVTTTELEVNLASYAGLLSSAEQARAEKFIFDKDRRLYTIAHAALRSILSKYAQTAPAGLQFDAGTNGKPKLPTDLPGDLRFNLSHSGDSALVAVSRGREIGIDIEFVNADFAFDEVAVRFFTTSEVVALRALPNRLQRQAFYQCWTSKEAFLKAKGTGLSGELDVVEIIVDREEYVRIDAHVPGWSLAEIDPGEGYVGALASEGEPPTMQLYRWRP